MSRAAVIELAQHEGLEVDDVLEYWAERAAVREIDGGQERDVAERAALDDIRALIALGTWTFDTRKGPRSVDAARDRDSGSETG